MEEKDVLGLLAPPITLLGEQLLRDSPPAPAPMQITVFALIRLKQRHTIVLISCITYFGAVMIESWMCFCAVSRNADRNTSAI